jgi:hypothetical protein
MTCFEGPSAPDRSISPGTPASIKTPPIPALVDDASADPVDLSTGHGQRGGAVIDSHPLPGSLGADRAGTRRR